MCGVFSRIKQIAPLTRALLPEVTFHFCSHIQIAQRSLAEDRVCRTVLCLYYNALQLKSNRVFGEDVHNGLK